jgi:hypothetical protein
MKTTGDGAQGCHAECLAPLAAFGESPSDKVLIYKTIFQGCQGCQPSFPGTLRWHPWQPAAGNKLPPLDEMDPAPLRLTVTSTPMPIIGLRCPAGASVAHRTAPAAPATEITVAQIGKPTPPETVVGVSRISKRTPTVVVAPAPAAPITAECAKGGTS